MTRVRRMLRAVAQRGRAIPTHFWFEVGGEICVYAYIRKNGCTAFKEFICAVSPHRAQRKEDESPMAFLSRLHRVPGLADFERARWRIAVYRDPLARAASLYRDKFVVRSSGGRLVERCTAVIGKEAGEISFDDFVERYLVPMLSGSSDIRSEYMDPHVRPQVASLAEGRYTHVFPLSDLHARMSEIIGHELVDRHFSIPRNSADVAPDDEPAGHVPAQALRARFLDQGRTPSTRALLSGPESRRLLAEELYADDLSWIDAQGRHAESATCTRTERPDA